VQSLSFSGSASEVVALAIALLGGLALFLYGMGQMTGSLRVVAGGRMRSILRRLTGNRFKAAITGAFVTAVIQSSSITTVLLVGFITAGLMPLAASVGVIIGANIGTTITAQIVAFKVTQYALLLVAIGFGLMFFSKRERARQIGEVVMGLGLIFFGMELMSEAAEPLRTYPPFIDVMRSMDRPSLAILAAAAFTALVQSSSATTGIIIVLAAQGFITLEAGIALALGANIGTCVTALLAALGKPRVALRAASIHILFNVVGVLLWVGLIGVLADVVRLISPAYPDLESQARLAAETPRQVANAHTLFNVINALIFIPLTTGIAWAVERWIPERPPQLPERARPLHLGEVYLETPALALDRVRLEVGHLGEIVLDVLYAARGGRFSRDRERMSAGVRDVELLHAEILRYARCLSRAVMGSRESLQLEKLLASANQLQNITDTVGVHLGTLGREWDERGLRASEETRTRLRELYDRIVGAVSLAIEAVRDTDPVKASRVVELKSDIVGYADGLSRHLAFRLGAADDKDVAVYRFESETVELLKRIYYFAKRMAKTV
jgi:phosphate:Na+ symporter